MTGSLTAAETEQFHHEGFLLRRGLLDPAADLASILDEYAGVLDRLATQLVADGELSTTYADLDFADRVVAVFAETGRDFTQHFDFSLPQASTRADTPFWTGPAVFQLIRNRAILDVIESLIGPEIYSNPVQHVRLKVPEQLMPPDPETGRPKNVATPWHQDNGVITADADATDMITVWLPLGDTDPANGCLMVKPRQHSAGVLPHCPAGSPMGVRRGGIGGLAIPGSHLHGDTVSLPMAAGDVLFMHRRTPHAAHRNTSDHLRWSFDLRYQPIGQPSGRDAFPGFVARSAVDPGAELRDPAAWVQSWLDARAAVAAHAPATYNRWDPDAIVCA
ncbi:phytanoyl-CoA dioxygenase family protein [Propionibacteriaceae bacterium Y2011]|uniref:phytanoyl-CoA dioxygenase family protein n=1 Tax=Microlunatus sp. Y2014 TaxID=3418488 RepID=UPI003B49C4FA